MNKLFKITSTIAFIMMLFVKPGNAEPIEGYVITMQGDTIKSTIDKAYFGNYKYTPLNSKQTIKIDADKIREFGYSDYVFVSINLLDHKKRLFAARLEKGPIYLFEVFEIITSGNTSEKRTYGFASKTNGNDVIPAYIVDKYLIPLAGVDKMRRRFDELLADNPTLLEKLKSADDYSQDAIQAVIQEYNKAAVLTIKH